MRRNWLTWWPWTARSPQGSGLLRRPLFAVDLTRGAVVVGLVSAATLAPAGGQALTWSAVPSPSINFPTDSSVLNAVSCVSAAGCMAVGTYYGSRPSGVTETALAESWSGTRWSVVPTSRSLYGQFQSVSCTSVTWCAAVGANAANPSTPIVESWTGGKWSRMPGAAPVGAELLGVSCASAADCTAVGDRVRSGYARTLIESWNGGRWSIVPSPGNGTGENFLTAVSCIPSAACTAVGNYSSRNGLHTGPLIESWNGKQWSLVPAPNKDNSGWLSGVSCAATRSCVAVGNYLDRSANDKGLLESWNGTRWTAEPAPSGQSQLLGVSCASATACWAAGQTWAPVGNTDTFAEFWNGTGWTVEPTPNPPPASWFHNPFGVSCASARFCAIAGDYGTLKGSYWYGKTLTEIGTAHS